MDSSACQKLALRTVPALFSKNENRSMLPSTGCFQESQNIWLMVIQWVIYL